MKTLLFAASLLAASVLSAAELKFSGLLCQSQPENPLPDRSAGPPALFGKTVLFTMGNSLWELDASGRKASVAKKYPGHLLSDGVNVYYYVSPRMFQLWRDQNGKLQLRELFRLPSYMPGINVVPANARTGYGAKMKFYNYDKKTKKVTGFDASGKNLGVVADLSGIRTQGPILSVSVMPGTGDLLYSVEWPDQRTYRIGVDGKAINGGIWPIGGRFTFFSACDNFVYGISPESAVRIEKTLSTGKTFTVGGSYNFYSAGICPDGKGGWYFGSSQGLKHYSKGTPHQADFRLGGTGGVRFLALSGGRIVAGSGYHMFSLNLDDLPDSPLESTGNEPWHVGANWESNGTGMTATEAGVFHISDAKYKCVWAFDPQKSGAKRMHKEVQNLKNPTDVTLLNGKLVIADDGKLSVPNDLKFPVLKVSAVGKDGLIAAGKERIAFLRNGKTVWTKLLKAADVAGFDSCMAVAGRDHLILYGCDGKLICSTPAKLSVIDASGKWLIGFDPKRQALCRFKLKK